MSRWHTTEFDMLPEKAFQPRGFKGSMTLEGSKGSSAPAPDPQMGEAAKEQVQLSKDQWAYYKDTTAPWLQDLAGQALGIQKSTADSANALTSYQLDNMKKNDSRYWDVAVPFEDQLLSDVNRFDSQGYKDQMVASAVGDVTQSFSGASEQQRRGLARMGVNPNSGKFAAASANMGFEEAKAMANAANKTRQAADQIGLSTKMSMYGGMKGLAGLGATNASLATGAMGTGLNAANGINSSGSGIVSANNSSFGTAMSGMTSGISGMGNYANLGIQAANVNAQNDPFNTMLGAAAGVATSKLISDRRLKKNIRKIGTMADGLGVYQYEYKWGGSSQIGVMADEVAVLRPAAHIPNAVGEYSAVDYAKL